MTSKTPDAPKAAFVWIWLPEATKPVVAGRIDLDNGIHSFTYSKRPCAARTRATTGLSWPSTS